MNTHPIVGDYTTSRDAFITQTKAPILFAYGDSRGVATIGNGIDLKVNGVYVLEQLGFDLTQATLSSAAGARERFYISQLLDLFQTTIIETGIQGQLTGNAFHTRANAILAQRASDSAYVGTPLQSSRTTDFALSSTQSTKIIDVNRPDFPGDSNTRDVYKMKAARQSVTDFERG